MQRGPGAGHLGRRGVAIGLAGLLPQGRARAQGAGRVRRVGSLHLAPWTAPHHVAFREGPARLGLVEGRGITLDPAGHGLRREAFEAHAAALVQQGVEVTDTSGDGGIQAALAVAPGLPILAMTDDLVRSGFARSLANPGGQVTGLSLRAAELDEKRQEILLELLPHARRLAALGDALLMQPERMAAQVAAAAGRGVALDIRLVRTPEEIGPAITAARAAGAEGLNLLATPLLFNNRALVYERVNAPRLPAVYPWPDMAREGGLIAYGPNMAQLYRNQMAAMLARLLAGAAPATLPIEQPTRFELVIHGGRAQALGIEIQTALLGRADAVVE